MEFNDKSNLPVYKQNEKHFKQYHRICVLDTETTDRYWNTAAPVQIAAIICDERGNIIDTFEEKIKTTHVIKPDASAVHGIYAEDLVNCRSEIAVLTDFCVWMKQQDVDVVLTYNGEAFDRRLLNNRCEKLGIHYDYFNKDKFPGIDGYYNCVIEAKRRNLWGLKDKCGRKWNLGLIAECLGVKRYGAHDALVDVMMLKDIFFMVDPVIHPENWPDEGGNTSNSQGVSLW